LLHHTQVVYFAPALYHLAVFDTDDVYACLHHLPSRRWNTQELTFVDTLPYKPQGHLVPFGDQRFNTYLGVRESSQELRKALFDAFKALSLPWRRIMIDEIDRDKLVK
jgi:hypothetical protein